MKAKNFIIVLIVTVLCANVSAQQTVYETLFGKINHVKVIGNTKLSLTFNPSYSENRVGVISMVIDEKQSKSSNTTFSKSAVKNMKYLDTAETKQYFRVIGDTLIVEGKEFDSVWNDGKMIATMPTLEFKNMPANIYVSEHSLVNIILHGDIDKLNVYADKNSSLVCTSVSQKTIGDIEIHQKDNAMVTFALLNIKNSLTLDIADSTSHFIATNITIDSLTKQSYIAPYYPLNNVNILGKHPTENIYTCDYKTYKTRFSNNMLSQSGGKPSEKDFYIEWATSLGLDYGFIAQEGDILGKGEGLNVDWDFYYLMHGGKHSSIGWGIGFGYNEKMFKNNQPVYSSSQNFSYDNKYYIGAWSFRIPIIYQYKFYPKHSFPISLEVGLTPYWDHFLHFINGKDASYMQLPKKSANELPTFDECFNSFQLDAHLGLQLGERFTIYSRFALRSATKKDNLDKANLISFGIKYKLGRYDSRED